MVGDCSSPGQATFKHKRIFRNILYSAGNQSTPSHEKHHPSLPSTAIRRFFSCTPPVSPMPPIQGLIRIWCSNKLTVVRRQ